MHQHGYFIFKENVGLYKYKTVGALVIMRVFFVWTQKFTRHINTNTLKVLNLLRSTFSLDLN